MKLYRYIFCMVFAVTSFMVMAQESIINRVDLTGQLAYVGDDYNIYSMDLANGEVSQLTADGTRDARYEFPSWSQDGQLAYFCCSVRGAEPPSLSVYISQDAASLGEIFYSNRGERHVYAYWSPVKCADADCVDLAVLVQDFREPLLRVDLFNSQSNTVTSQRALGEGTPFYFSWSPSGNSMIIHRNNSTLQYYSVSSDVTTEAVEETLGNFLSPGWSPTDDRILYTSLSDNQQSQLTILENNRSRAISSEIDGILSFSWSPNGEYIAYRYITKDSVSPVYVVDADTGELVSQSNVSGVFSFFWSPDSTKIAYVTLSNPPGTFDINNDVIGDRLYLMQATDGLAWNILNVDDNTNTLLNSFIPTSEMQYLLTNFDQFAQSHSLWSPNSDYIVYGEVTDIDAFEPSITLLDVNNANTETIQIANGVFAVWSFD